MTNPIGKCSCPMWTMGIPDGCCGKPAWGKYIPGEEFRDGYTGELCRVDGKFNGYVPGLACPAHGGPEPDAPRVYQDGYSKNGYPMYCAVYPDFINLQESPAEFHEKPWVAVRMLLKNHSRGLT